MRFSSDGSLAGTSSNNSDWIDVVSFSISASFCSMRSFASLAKLLRYSSLGCIDSSSRMSGKHSDVPVVRNSTVTLVSVTTSPDSLMAQVDFAICNSFFPASRDAAPTCIRTGSCLHVTGSSSEAVERFCRRLFLLSLLASRSDSIIRSPRSGSTSCVTKIHFPRPLPLASVPRDTSPSLTASSQPAGAEPDGSKRATRPEHELSVTYSGWRFIRFTRPRILRSTQPMGDLSLSVYRPSDWAMSSLP